MKNLIKRADSLMANRQSSDAATEPQFVQPRVSVLEDAEKVYLNLEMPGVDRDKIEVTVEHDELTVTGYRSQEDYGEAEIIHRERLPLNYRRSFILSDKIDNGTISATYDRGVLKLSLPKSEGSKPRKITIE